MTIRLGVIPSLSIANPCAFEPKCPVRGYGVDAAVVVCEYLRLNCSFSWFNETAYGDFNETSGVGTGLIGAIYRGEIDTSIPILTPTYSRFQAVSFSNSFFYADVVAVTRTPIAGHFFKKSLNWNFVDAFQWPVWLCILLSLITACLLISYAQGGLDHHLHRKKLLNFFETALALMTRQYGIIETRPTSAVGAVTLWALVFVVLTSAYTGELFSQKMTTTVKPPVTDVDGLVDCVVHSQCSIVVSSPAASYLQLLLVPGSTVTARLQKAFLYNPVRVIRNKTEIAKTILENDQKYLVWITSKNDFSYYLSDHKAEACKFYVVDMPYDDNCGFAVRKNDTKLLRRFNHMADWFRELGMEYKIGSGYFNSSSTCTSGGTENNVYVEFWEITIIMYFYAAGIIFSLVALGFEFLYGKYGKTITDTPLSMSRLKV